MNVIQLVTNDDRKLINDTDDERMSKMMQKYIQTKRSQGFELHEILFCWIRIEVTED